MSLRVEGAVPPGYRRQSDEAREIARAMTHYEAKLLRALDDLAGMPEIDQRWLAIGRTDVEKGFLAINRAITGDAGRRQPPRPPK